MGRIVKRRGGYCCYYNIPKCGICQTANLPTDGSVVMMKPRPGEILHYQVQMRNPDMANPSTDRMEGTSGEVLERCTALALLGCDRSACSASSGFPVELKEKSTEIGEQLSDE